MRLQPYVSSLYVIKLGMNYYCISRYEEAKDTAEKFRRMSQSQSPGKGIVWVAYQMLAMDYMRLNWRGLGGVKSAVDSSLGYSPHIPPYFFMPLSFDIPPFILPSYIIRSLNVISHSPCFSCLNNLILPSEEKDFTLPILVHDMMPYFWILYL